VAESEATPVHYDASLKSSSVAEPQLAYSAARDLTGG
jgi:hypothetical protein